jgi:hypothetical protein
MAITWRKIAYTDNPVFTGTLEVPAVKITTGAGSGKVLTSDADGDGTWETPAASSGTSIYWQTLTAESIAVAARTQYLIWHKLDHAGTITLGAGAELIVRA